MMTGEIEAVVRATPDVLEALWGFLEQGEVGSPELTEYARTVHDLAPPDEPPDATWLMGVAFPESGPDRGELRWIGRVPGSSRHDR